MEFSSTVVRLIQSGVQKYKDATRREVAITLVANPGEPFTATRRRQAGSDSNFERYRLIIEPWFRFLGSGHDRQLLQKVTVCDILDAGTGLH